MGQTCGCTPNSQLEYVSSLSSDTLARPKSGRILSLPNLLDIFDDFRPYVNAVRLALDQNLSTEECANRIIMDSAKNGSAKSTVDIITENLRILTILTKANEMALLLMESRIDDWKFDVTGRTDAAPQLAKDVAEVQLSQFDMNVIRQIAFAQLPSELHSYTAVIGLSDNLFNSKADNSPSPVAVITVGAPGSGKDYLTIDSEYCCLDYLRENHQGPPRDDFVLLDPDYWVSNLCHNRNEHRVVGNFLNLEQFFYAINRRHSLVFNGTGKDVKNTLGRVTSRLKEANYRIFFCIVLADFETVLARIQDRFRRTGRDVPVPVVRSIFQGLQTSVPLYLEKQADIAEAICVYNNSGSNEPRPTPKFTVLGGNSKEAIEFARANLALPTE